MIDPEADGGRGKQVRLAVVGPCSSGKSTLAARLEAAGFEVRKPAQEHSYVANMWQRISKPDLLIYLDVDYPTSLQRRPYIDGGPERVDIQNQRLAHARAWCDVYLDTVGLTPDQVFEQVMRSLQPLIPR